MKLSVLISQAGNLSTVQRSFLMQLVSSNIFSHPADDGPFSAGRYLRDFGSGLQEKWFCSGQLLMSFSGQSGMVPGHSSREI